MPVGDDSGLKTVAIQTTDARIAVSQSGKVQTRATIAGIRAGGARRHAQRGPIRCTARPETRFQTGPGALRCAGAKGSIAPELREYAGSTLSQQLID